MHESFQNNVQHEFVDYETTTPVINEQIHRFIKTGKNDFVTEEDQQNSAINGSERTSKLGNTLLYKPRDFMGSLHRRTHFKAGETI